MSKIRDFYWVFYKLKTNKYLILADCDHKNGGLGDLLDDGYEIVWDSALSKEAAKKSLNEQIETYLEWYQRDFPLEAFPLEAPSAVKLETVPITFKVATDFVNKHHRHHGAPQGHKFSIGLNDGDRLIGVAIAGNPISRHNDDGRTLEITRCCLKSSVYKNGVSKLLSAVYQVAKAMGYHRIISYTLEEENGISLCASGFYLDRNSCGGSWSSPTRQRVDKAPIGPKKRWTKKIK
ncbi:MULTISPECIES: XF1762 family protein [Bacillota]|uniref:XF1762 family protein n=1 Tax=Bacillota TaxID=1239 RepID=UPI0039F0E952